MVRSRFCSRSDCQDCSCRLSCSPFRFKAARPIHSLHRRLKSAASSLTHHAFMGRSGMQGMSPHLPRSIVQKLTTWTKVWRCRAG